MTGRAFLAGVAAALLLAGCGGAARSQPKVYTSPEAPQVTLPAGRHFIGSGSKRLGTIVVKRRSVLAWASDGPVFQLWDSGQRIRVRTQEHSGTVKLAAGTYVAVSVLAVGHWAVTISPG